MQIVLTIVCDIERNLVRVERAGIRGLGDLESEIKVGGVDPNEPGGEITLEEAGLPSPLTQEPPKPGNLMREPPKAKPSQAAAQGSLAAELLTLGLDEEQVASLLHGHSIERLRKLLGWVRTVQAREGCHSPSSLFLKCIAKGVQ